mgnify:FL=1
MFAACAILEDFLKVFSQVCDFEATNAENKQ